MSREPLNPRAQRDVWGLIESLIGLLEENYIAGERQVEILAPVLAKAGAMLGYDLELATEIYTDRDRPWVVEALRRAGIAIENARSDEDESGTAPSGALPDRSTGDAGGIGVPELGAVSAGRAGTPRGRRGGARPGAD